MVVSQHAAATELETGLPIFSACAPTAPPVLPEKWRAVGLMLPLTRAQLDVGEFTYDGAVPAMRATVYGLESGAVDLLITDETTYQLIGNPDAPERCIALGRKYRVPSRQWLSSAAVCEGEASVGPKRAQWWKVPVNEGRTQRQWYAADTRLPWRMMFPNRLPDPAVIADYAVTYFPTFKPSAETKLAQLRDFCVAKAQKAGDAVAAAQTARDVMAAGDDISEAQRAQRIETLIPGLSQKACAGVKPPVWPHHFVMTGILTPVQFKWTPLPSMIYYDWEEARTLFAYMYRARALPPAVEIVSALSDTVGYSVEQLPNGVFACGAKGPGVVRPNWMANANCDCKAIIDRNPDLSPHEVSEIRACPVRHHDVYPMWTWYSTAGRPILFTEPRAVSTGLHIADYHRWLPGEKMPRDSFALPRQCTHAREAGLPPVGNGIGAADGDRCSACHVVRQ